VAAAATSSSKVIIIMKNEKSNYWQVLKKETWKNSNTLYMKNWNNMM
jgi:hypothetical protein